MNDVAVGPFDDLPLRDRRRPPAPHPPGGKLSWLALYRGLRNNPITTWGERVYQEPIITDRDLLGSVVIVNRPGAIRRVFLDNAQNYPKDAIQLKKLGPALGRGLLTSERDDWRFQRRTVAPLFQPSSVAAYFPVMVEAMAAMLARWESAARDGTVVDAAREMTALTYDIISRTLFSNEIETGPDVMSAAITRFFDTHGRINLWDVVNFPAWVPHPAQWRVRPATRVFRYEVRRLLEQRRARQAAGQPVPNDLVTLLAAARDPETGAALSEETIHDNLVTFIGAGHETTANALGWTLFLLSEYPWAFDRMAQEVDAVLAGRTPTVDDVARLTRMMLEEAVRLYPPVPFLSREAAGPDRIDGVDIAPGSLVIVAPWPVHRHQLLWQEPDLFEPERFAPERRQKIPRFGYLPFGIGSRVCIGQSFAMQEALVALAMIAQRFRPCLLPGAYVQPVARITLRPARGLPMRIERRGRTAQARLFLSEPIEPHDFGAAVGLRRAVSFRCRLGFLGGRSGLRRCSLFTHGQRFCRGLLRVGGRWSSFLGTFFVGRPHGLELKSELHRGVEEPFDGVERDRQVLVHPAERETHLERLLVDAEVAVLVLKHDRHFIGILRAQAPRQAHPRRAGVEGNIKVMLAREAVVGGVLEHPAQHGAQRLLGQQVVTDVIDRHDAVCHPESLRI